MTEHDIECMTKAIDEAAKSKSDSPNDPKVGAVVSKDGEIIGSAHRGQRDAGNHAEFTLLHKILGSKDRTQGATLYTTLEPCTSRSHEKLPCAEWIVQKGIRRVVIGILDPNPTICGRGYWHLVDAGIELDFFPAALAKQIADLNTDFVQVHRGKTGRPSQSVVWAIQRAKNSIIAPYTGTGWGDALSLQDCPYVREGWPMAQVQLRLESDNPFVLPARYLPAYQDYFTRNYEEKRFMDDGKKFMLTHNPSAFSDSPSLVLTVRPTKYSHVQYYRDNVAVLHAERSALIEELVHGTLGAGFPHAFCMHMVVVTSDTKLLLTRRSPKVAYYPGTWSASVEEQLAASDLEAGDEPIVLTWGRRLLLEELGLEQASYHTDNLRILSVFVESDILNTSLCAYAELNIDSKTLDAMIRTHPRTDYEFTECRYLPLERKEILSELFRPPHSPHPTTGYRLLRTFFKNFGMPKHEEIRDMLPLLA
jgi:pyrimidine deaminase RibD-like protein/isopentenyldiphosphate isomerase